MSLPCFLLLYVLSFLTFVLISLFSCHRGLPESPAEETGSWFSPQWQDRRPIYQSRQGLWHSRRCLPQSARAAPAAGGSHEVGVLPLWLSFYFLTNCAYWTVNKHSLVRYRLRNSFDFTFKFQCFRVFSQWTIYHYQTLICEIEWLCRLN